MVNLDEPRHRQSLAPAIGEGAIDFECSLPRTKPFRIVSGFGVTNCAEVPQEVALDLRRRTGDDRFQRELRPGAHLVQRDDRKSRARGVSQFYSEFFMFVGKAPG